MRPVNLWKSSKCRPNLISRKTKQLIGKRAKQGWHLHHRAIEPLYTHVVECRGQANPGAIIKHRLGLLEWQRHLGNNSRNNPCRRYAWYQCSRPQRWRRTYRSRSKTAVPIYSSICEPRGTTSSSSSIKFIPVDTDKTTCRCDRTKID